MTTTKWLLSALMVVALAVGGTFAFANAHGYSCPIAFIHAMISGEQSSCGNCCTSSISSTAPEEPYTCPLTGEDLPCEKCCPLNENN